MNDRIGWYFDNTGALSVTVIDGITHIAAPTSVPADGSTAATVTLSGVQVGHRVRIFSSRGSIDVFSPSVGTVNSYGQFVTSIRSFTPGTSVLTAQDLTTGEIFAISTTIIFTPVGGGSPPPPANGDFDFVVTPTYALNGRFLEGLSLPNRVLIDVPWPADPGVVLVRHNGTEVHRLTAPNVGSRYEVILDMGITLAPGPNSLEIVALPPNGASVTKSYRPWSWPTPVWLTTLQNLGLAGPLALAGDWNTSLDPKFEAQIKIPEQPFEALEDFGITGKKAGVEPTYFEGKLEVPLLTDHNGKVSGAAYGGFALWDGDATWTGGLSAEGRWVAAPPYLQIDRVGPFLELTYKQRVYQASILATLANLSPGIGATVAQFARSLGIENYLQRYGYVYVDGSVNLNGEMSLLFEPEVHPEWFRGGGGLGIEGGVRIYVKPIEAHAYVGAEGEVEMATDPDFHISRMALVGKAGVEFIAFWFKTGVEGKIEFVYPQPVQDLSAAGHPGTATPAWRLISHPESEAYAVFATRGDAAQAFAAPATAQKTSIVAQTTVTSVLVSNAYTYTEPALAVNPADDTALLLWVHDDLAKPVGQSIEINFSRWNGSTWSTPAAVTDDDRLDSAPQVAWAGNGQGVAVWQRLNATLPITATFDITTARQIEIATATFDPATGAWSAPALLTNNGALDMIPVLARRANGDLLAVWRQNDAGLLSGDAFHPDRIMAAHIATNWTAPAVAVDNIPGLVDLAAGYGTNAATLAYTQFITPTGSVTPTLQLFTSTWNGAIWSAPSQLTDDDLGHTDPQVVYNSANQPLLIWLAGGELRLRNLATANEAALALPAAIGGVDEFRAVQDLAGNLAAVFSAQASRRDLYVAFYDLIHGLWGLPRTLTADTWSEGYPAPALDTTGRLLMGYAATEIVPITRTATITATGQVVTYTLPTEGQTDLVTLSHVFVHNLTLGDSDLTVSTDHPAPGGSVVISATVRNSGDLALDGVAVAFYDGDPQAGGALIGTTTLPQPLAAGYTATLTTLYSVPTTGGARAIHAVADPGNQIVEADEGDNRASLAAFGPDLALVEATVELWGGSDVGLVTRVQNIGTTASPTATVAFYRQAITGTLVTTDTLPPLAAGAAYTLTTPWNYGSLAAGEYGLVAAVNREGADFPEVATANNQASLTLWVGPDLMVSPFYVWLSPTITSTVLITAAVYNVGSTSSPDATVAVYHGDPTNPENLIFSQTVPGLAPAGVAYLTGTWRGAPGGAQSVTVWVDPTQAIMETSQANNLAAGDVTVPFVQQAVFALSPGWNLLTLPLLPASTTTAQSWLDAINSQGDQCSEINRWLNGGWDAHINNLPFNDFVVEPGKGYFLKCNATSQWTLEGFAFAAGVPIILQPGWNLIGVPHPPSGYTAQSLLDAIASQGGACSEVNRWLNGGWDAHIGGLPFNNFSVEPDKGYFVKCSQSSIFVPD